MVAEGSPTISAAIGSSAEADCSPDDCAVATTENAQNKGRHAKAAASGQNHPPLTPTPDPPTELLASFGTFNDSMQNSDAARNHRCLWSRGLRAMESQPAWKAAAIRCEWQ